jgi:DNA-binding transcriptional LysR family regulator
VATPALGDGTGLAVVTMDTGFAEMPDAVWLRRLLPKARIAFRSNNRDVQAQACLAGAGLAVLPRPLGDSIPRLQRIELESAPPGRDVWVGYHRDLRQLARLRALLDATLTAIAG